MQSLYKTMSKELKNLEPNFDPSNAMIDFERVFGLKTSYGEDENFAQRIRCLPALTFLPIADVVRTFEQIKGQFPVAGEPGITYFEENYICVRSRLSRPRKPPKFDLQLWNVNTNTLQGQHRTNNAVEGHPNLWKFLKGLKTERSYVDAQITQATAGERQARKREQVRRETRILNILYESTTTNFDKKMFSTIEEQMPLEGKRPCGANANLSDFNGVTNVSFADDPLVTDYLSNPRVEILVENKSDEKLSPSIFEGNPLLYFLCKHTNENNPKKISEFIQFNPHVNIIELVDYDFRSIAHLAVAQNQLEII
ncbi:unnamed protein product [Adineta ricciae]|uniref:Uncharacterized protein n=1 Tax=Adineta ricciae TaxID=249248 RepID=A0A814XUZ9_ADIRI|nr:unnamed protein product [Adineta ricciae]CAF1221033.1 unnamed protein product [Adineta ricciae]